MEQKTVNEIHPKGWGREEWIYNSDLYCGKFLIFQRNRKCSWHYHILKDEVFHVLEGKIKIKFSPLDNLDEANSIELSVGETFHIPRQIRHQVIALEESRILEISTTHYESDTIRVARGD